MRFVCESCRAQYMINDEKVGPEGRQGPMPQVRLRHPREARRRARRAGGAGRDVERPDDALATQVMQTPLAAAEATLSNDEPAHRRRDMTNPGTATASPTLPGAVDPARHGQPRTASSGRTTTRSARCSTRCSMSGTGNHTGAQAFRASRLARRSAEHAGDRRGDGAQARRRVGRQGEDARAAGTKRSPRPTGSWPSTRSRPARSRSRR